MCEGRFNSPAGLSNVVEADLNREPNRDGFIALARGFETPLADCVQRVLVDVFVDRMHHVYIDGEAARTDHEADQDDAADAESLLT
jgi:hypothetical protein